MLKINNIRLKTKISLKIVIFLIGFWSFLLNTYASIDSTTNGGNWTSTGTWIGGVIPGVNDDVTIRGEVILDTYSTIKSLTINENGVIKKDSTLNQQSLTINSDFVNNGEIKGRIEYFYVKGKTINNGTINNIGNFYIYGDFENNGIFNTLLRLGGDVEITKKLDFANNIYLNGYKLKVPKDSYIKLLVGPGEINSQTSINGNGEKIIIGRPAFNITSNFETVEINEIFTTGIGGMLNSRNVYINNDVYYGSDVIYNGNLIIGDNGRLYKHFSSNTTSMTINGDLINYGILDGLSYAGYTYVNVSGNLLNKGSINYITGGLYIKGNIDNINGNIVFPSKTYIKWDNIQDYTNYTLNITDLSDITLNTNQYLLNDNIKETGANIYWKVKGKGLIFDSDWSESKCINVSGCVNISLPWEEEQPIQIPTPTKLNQYIIPATLEEKEEIQVGSKIGKFQSGSGVIFELELDNPESKELKIKIELYEKLSGNTRVLNSDFLNVTGKRTFTIPLEAGDYTWKLRLEDTQGNTSDWIEFENNGTDTDFSIFEGFEPYPYGYSFFNSHPSKSSLTGGIDSLILDDGLKSEYIRKIAPGNKWEIFNNAFNTLNLENNQKKLFDAFETVGLNKEETSLNIGSCYGMSISAIMAKYHKLYIEDFNSNYLNILGSGSVFDIPSPKYVNNEWEDPENDILKTIMSLQLSFKSNRIQYLAENGTGSIDKIFTTLNINPDKKYIMFFGNDNKTHAVIPYRIESNGLFKRIYYWDNVVPYPNITINGVIYDTYKQYIEIDSYGNWESPYWKKDFGNFNLIGLIDIEDIYEAGKSLSPIGFNGIDYLYTLNGSSDIIVKDEQGRVSGFINGEVKRDIPGVNIITPNGENLLGNENTFKQIYLPQKLENLTIEINGKVNENYDLMIAGGDYYTKLEGITTSSGQTDIFNISRENIKIDLDDTKTNSGTYNILVDDFQNNGTGSVYIDSMKINKNLQQYNINWPEVINNTNNAVNYQIDTNNDGNYDINTNFSPIYQDNVSPTTTYNLIGTKTPNTTNNSYIETLDIELNSTDNENGTGVDKIYYSLDNTETTEKIYLQYNNQIEVNGVGNYTLSYYAIDKFGNKEEEKTINFILTEKPETYAGNISGYIYDDSNKNTILDTGEKTMAGWKVCIDINNNNDCEENIEPFNVTNNNGYYEFNSLVTGTYNIKLIPHQNWELTNPTSGRYTITLSNGQVVTNKNFGAYKTKGGNK